ncbi:MAG: glycosyltransferase family 2 protein [Alphaproteobacteria bacterium]|nr:glycosyltransferase family 2 protein [Alphaproteobacteria bacterium]
MTKPKISIIIPVYNVEKYLRRCLDSVLNQTFQNWQAICINDGSTDKSGAILDKYAARDKRFVVVHKKNGGVSRARNDGIKKASGEYIMFLDSDDCIHPQTMDIVYRLAKDNKSDIVSFQVSNKIYKGILNGADADKIIQESITKKYDLNRIKYKKTDTLINYATERNHKLGRFLVHHCYPVIHLYKTNLVKGISFNHNIKICEDFPFFTSVLLRNPKSTIINVPLYFYIPNGASALKSVDARNFFDNFTMAIIEAFSNVSKANPTKKWTNVWQREFLWPFIISCVRTARNLSGAYVKKQLTTMQRMGMFDNPPTMRARKYKRRIENIISQI